jgi:hypothetical protein
MDYNHYRPHSSLGLTVFIGNLLFPKNEKNAFSADIKYP